MGFLIFQPAFCVLGEGPAAPILRQPCLGRVSVSPAREDGDGHSLSRYFQAFVLWRLSLAAGYASSEGQSSRGCIVAEQRDCGPFSTDVLATLTLLLLVLLNPAASRDVRPTPGVPALTSRAGASLSFVFLMPPATGRPARSRVSRSQSMPGEHTSIPEFREKPGGARTRFRVSVCCFAGADRESARSPVQVARQPPAAPRALREFPVSVWIP